MQKEDLLNLKDEELDRMFRAGAPGPIPSGNASGEAIIWSGTFWSKVIAKLAHDLAWQGKIFTPNPDGDGATLVNKLGPTGGLHAVVARVYMTTSWCDGKPCVVLDYSKTSLLGQKLRDEIRLIDPVTHLYLGKVWWGTRELIAFALEFPS
jgi:hypothetical protein